MPCDSIGLDLLRYDRISIYRSDWIPITISVVFFIVFVGLIILAVVKVLQARRAAKEFASRPRGHFVFAKILDSILPMERRAKYADPLDKELRAKGFGSVTGAGTQMSRDNSRVEWIGIDLELVNLDDALVFARDPLRELGAPAGSVLEYRDGAENKTIQIS